MNGTKYSHHMHIHLLRLFSIILFLLCNNIYYDFCTHFQSNHTHSTHSIWLCLLVFDFGTYCSDFGDRILKLRVITNNLLPIYTRNFDNRLSFINTRSVSKARAKIIYIHNYCGSVIVHHLFISFHISFMNYNQIENDIDPTFPGYFCCATIYVGFYCCVS